MQITGTIKVLKDTQEVSDKFKKRELVVTTEETYPQDILIEFSQDKCSILDKYAEGQGVTVDINIRGRCWSDPKTGQDRYFNSIQGWKIEATGSSATVPNNSNSATSTAATAIAEVDNDLPF